MFYVYIVRCSDGTFYCGQTTDLKRRIEEHSLGKSKSAKYTKSRRPVKLEYFERFKTAGKALKREAQIKQLTRKGKVELIKRKQIK